jgi:hypothetical protein
MNRTVCPKGMVDTCCENYDNCTLARKYPPYTAHDWLLQERDIENQLRQSGIWFDRGRQSAFREIAEKVKSMPREFDTKDSFLVWLKEQT